MSLLHSCTHIYSHTVYLCCAHTDTHTSALWWSTSWGTVQQQEPEHRDRERKWKKKGQKKRRKDLKETIKKKECGYHGNPHPPTHTPSLHFHSLSRSLSLLSPPSLHLCAGDARVSFLSIRFVLTSPGRAPLTLPTDDTRGGGGGRGDEEKLLSLFSQLSITLKKRKKERETRPEQQPKERTHRIYIHTYKRKRNPTLLHSPFQGGHFSSLSPPFLFYPDFFLWDPGFVKL